jgi:predicted membrane GTPase involved in stress response
MEDINPLFDVIVEKVPEASLDTSAQFRMQITNLAYDNYL